MKKLPALNHYEALQTFCDIAHNVNHDVFDNDETCSCLHNEDGFEGMSISILRFITAAVRDRIEAGNRISNQLHEIVHGPGPWCPQCDIALTRVDDDDCPDEIYACARCSEQITVPDSEEKVH